MRKLTFENHLKRDTRLDGWTPNGLGPTSASSEFWIKQILSVELDPSIPEELREIFERIKACMVYGCYHYPLFTTAIEELLRYNESILKFAGKALSINGPPEKTNFHKLIEWFGNNGFLDAAEKQRWHAGRELRNSVSHKTNSMTLGPNHALGMLHHAKDQTHEIFEKVRRSPLSTLSSTPKT